MSGPVERLSSIVNGSIKHLPLRYRLADRAVTRSPFWHLILRL